MSVEQRGKREAPTVFRCQRDAGKRYVLTLRSTTHASPFL
jgi:hypothetical protein